MKGIAVLKAALEKLAGFALRRRGIHCGPFRGELRSALKAPIGIFFGDSFSKAFIPKVLE